MNNDITTKIQKMLQAGYSEVAIAIMLGGSYGTKEFYDMLLMVDPKYVDISPKCPNCGTLRMGTGNCNCEDT